MSDNSKKHTPLIMGTAGHIDHGKTSLVKALTGVDLDKLEEEKRRGITIELGFVSLALGSGEEIGVVDVPGHEKFIKTMVAGAHGIDFVMLVIAADEGVMPQTREHFDICKLLGVRKGFVALTKSDKADKDMIALASEEVRELTKNSFLEGAPIIPCSAVTGDGIPAILSAIGETAAQLSPRSQDGIFRMPIDRSFTVKGMGTVVTGSVVAGKIKKGDTAQVLPGGWKSVVRDLEVHGEKVETAYAGVRLALNLPDFEKSRIGKGFWVVEVDSIKTTSVVDAWVNMLPARVGEIEHGQEIGLHAGTAFVIATVDLLGTENISAGDERPVRLRFKESLPLVAGEKFVLRSFARRITVGGGEVFDPHPGFRIAHRGKKAKKEIAGFLTDLKSADIAGRINLLVGASNLQGVSRKMLYLRVNESPAKIDAAIEKQLKENVLSEAGSKDRTLF